MQSKFKRILFGGDYNPNQWPKEVWEQDMAYFKDAHINSATINVFSWAKIQPSENEYNFTELDEIVDMLSNENYDIVMATSTAALPAWMVKKYEILKLLMKNPDRIYTIEMIYEMVWDEAFTYNAKNTVMVHIKNLRNKLIKACGDACIHTEWGRGYRFER